MLKTFFGRVKEKPEICLCSQAMSETAVTVTINFIYSSMLKSVTFLFVLAPVFWPFHMLCMPLFGFVQAKPCFWSSKRISTFSSVEFSVCLHSLHRDFHTWRDSRHSMNNWGQKHTTRCERISTISWNSNGLRNTNQTGILAFFIFTQEISFFKWAEWDFKTMLAGSPDLSVSLQCPARCWSRSPPTNIFYHLEQAINYLKHLCYMFQEFK